MSKFHSQYICQQCGYAQVGWSGKCPNCGEWNSLVETVTEEKSKSTSNANYHAQKAEIQKLDAIKVAKNERISTKIPEFDRVLGGGIVGGQVILLAGEPGIGKCVAADTLISTGRGLIPIVKLRPKNADKGFVELRVPIQSLDGVRKTSHFYTSDKQATKRITTQMGYELQATYTHPVLTLSRQGKKIWKNVDKIEVGDYVAIQRHGSIWGKNTTLAPFKFKVRTNALIPNFPKKIDESMAYCLGLLTGDGGLTDFGRVNLTTSDLEIKKNFEDWISSLGLKVGILEYRLSVSSRIFHLWLQNMGIKSVRAESKNIPELILSSPKRIIKAFLQGLFDTDGSSNSKPNGSLPGVVEYCTVSRQLANQIHILLLQFGIVGKMRFKKNQKQGAWIIGILGNNARLFYSEIGFRLSRKQKNRQLLSESSNTNLDIIPYLPFIDPSKIPSDHRWDRRYLKGVRSASYKKLEAISRYAPELKTLLEPKFYWDKVKVVANAGKTVCFDLCVPKTHSFVTNGIVGHNSTILLQLANNIDNCLYVSGEESGQQVAIRAKRLVISSKTTNFLDSTDIDSIIASVSNIKDCKLIIIDSIQTMVTGDLTGLAGSVGQVRECSARLVRFAKSKNIPVFIVGHVTKEKTVAGPSTLAHIVDTVLWFEGDKTTNLRLIRSYKNRFGATDEVGIFEMGSDGLTSITNPQKLFLSNVSAVPGSIVTSILEGTRPILVEIQSLVVATKLPFPRRVAQGIDSKRLEMLIAILIKRGNLPLWNQDIFVNVTGGISIKDPAADLAVCLCITSAFMEKSLKSKTVAIGEVGLLGEVRKVVGEDKRIKEAARLGYITISQNSKNQYLPQVINNLLLPNKNPKR